MSILNTDEIKRRREAVPLTQGEAAEAADLGHRQRWNAIESGRKPTITLETLSRIAQALKCKPGELLKDEVSAKSTARPVKVIAKPRKPAAAAAKRRKLATAR